MCPTISDFYFHSPLYVATWRREVCSCVYTWFRIIFLVKFLLIELLLLCLRMRRDKFYLNIYLKRRCSIKCKKSLKTESCWILYVHKKFCMNSSRAIVCIYFYDSFVCFVFIIVERNDEFWYKIIYCSFITFFGGLRKFIPEISQSFVNNSKFSWGGKNLLILR